MESAVKDKLKKFLLEKSQTPKERYDIEDFLMYFMTVNMIYGYSHDN